MSHCPLFKTTPISGYSAAFRRLVASFVLCLGLIGAAHGQNSRYDGIVWSRNGFPSPAASIDVCSQPASPSTTPPYCVPLASLCSSATDAVCSSPNPVTADSMGNFHFYVKPGVYTLESYNSSLSPFAQPDQVLSCPPSSTCTLTILQVGDGTVGAPAYSFTNATSSGWYRAGTNDFRFSIGGVDAFRLNGSFQAIVPPTGMFGFGSSGVTSPDICFTRSAAGTAALGNCTAADGSGFLTLTQLTSFGNANTNWAFSGRDATFTTATGSNSQGGSLTFTLGNGSNAQGGFYSFTAGNGSVNGAGGSYSFTAGNGANVGAGGSFNFTAGNGGGGGGAAGNFNFNCGTSSGTQCALNLVSGSEQWNGQPIFVYVTGDFSTAANTNLQAITGLTWTMPGSLAVNLPFDCYFQYSQATAAVSDSFGIQDVTTAPTQINANGLMQTNTTAFSAGPGVVALASTTATPILTATPSAITTVWHAEIHGVIEQPSGTASAITIMAKTTTAADVLTVKRGSYCRIGPK